MNRIAFALASLALSSSLVACRGSDPNPTGDDAPGVDAPPGGPATIQEVQNEAMSAGTPVELAGVIVTAIDSYGMRTGDFWVQEPGGGPFSGVHVFGAPLDQVGGLALGDIVNVTGAEKDEFALASDTSGKTTTELKPLTGGTMTVTKVSSGTPVTPTVVDALMIGQKATQAERDAEWEKWEGVLITVNNVAAFNAPICVGATCTDPTLKKFDVTGQLVVESALSDFPMTGLTRNACLASATGVVDYFFDYLLYNRTTTEVATGGTGCAVENTPALCSDGIDNDGNGFSECQDNACVLGSPTCHPATTISAIQMAATPPTGGVELQGVTVAKVSRNKKNMWVQTNVTAAANEGIYVFGPGNDLDGFAVGSKVNIIGTVEEFNDATGTDTLTELKALSVTAATGAGTVVPVMNQTAANLSVAATGEPYESVLVTLSNVKITLLGTSATFGVGAMQQGTTTFKTDDDVVLPFGAVGTCYATITGFWTYLPYENAYGFLPLGPGVTAGGNCP